MAEVTEDQQAPPESDAPEQDEAAEEALSPFLEAVRAPISDADPVGTDVKYEDSFQQLKAEVDKVQSANADADFDRIVELGKQILTKQSKDLTAAAYLGFGLIRTDGLSGLAEGIGAVQMLCETYWDDLYPPTRRMVARKNALQLLIDRVHEWLEPQSPKKSDRDVLEQALARYKALQALATEKMGEDVPVFSRVAKLLEAKLRAIPKDAPPPKPAAAPAAGDGASSGTVAAPPTNAAGGAVEQPGELRSPTEADASIRRAVAFLRERDKTAPAPFRLLRALRWGRLVEAPPAQNGKTLVEPYLGQRKDFLTGLLEKKQFDRLVTEVEGDFIEHPFWLDLQRFLVTALDALGGPYAIVREGVVGDLAVLLHQFPEFPSLRFSDGTPFADGSTQEWINAHVRAAFGGGDTQGGSASSSEDGSAVEADYAEAREHLMKGDLGAAVAALGAGADASGHERFRRKLYLATLCMRGEKSAVARPILEGLDAEIERHQLDMWMPTLTLDVWAALYGCYGALQRTAEGERKDELRQAADHVFERICALAPARALTVMDQGTG